MRTLYDAEEFRKHAHAIVDRLADHHAKSPDSVVPWRDPRAQVEAWQDDFRGGAEPIALLERVIAGATHLHHPGFVGHQVTAPLPLTAIAAFVSGYLNNGAAVYEMGPVSSAMERVVAGFLCQRLGYGPSADAIFTSGGSAGNLTALVAARERSISKIGARGASEPFLGAVLTCEEAHYSTARAVRVMGWGDEGTIRIPSDERFKLDPRGLDAAYERARAGGRRVIAVVASACSTSTGAFDPLPEIADFCAAKGLWMHVDGAHGASFVLSKHRDLLRGIERADSVVWDAHKMMLCPALATAVLFKDARDSFAAFQGTEAAYLLESDENAAYDSAVRTLECTKGMLILGLYTALAVHGEGAIARYLGDIVDLSAEFAAMLQRAGFELAVKPECNIVCFRAPGDDERQERIRRWILEQGDFYIVKTKLRGRTYLRSTIINPRTTRADLERLIATIRELPHDEVQS
jgi:L-2,4-diaminobutyrate decarboxylase